VNSLGLLMLGSIAHATGFTVIGAVAYLALRRWSPAAGALAAASSLLITAMVSMIVLAPWPCWWTFPTGQTVRSTVASAREMPAFMQTPRFGGADEQASPLGVPGDSKQLASPPRNETQVAAAWMSRFLTELRRSAVDREHPSWSWPEWVAIGFLASFGLGLARLALGAWSIKRLRARSLAIEEIDLIDAVEVLRAELSCARRVDIRETFELATPATIGWRRPLLLLPTEWRNWSEAERRTVLAHELAHVCRGDFLTGLVAQVSVTLHFYNPLAHWLAARLRLEQELAADAWAACLAGGKQAYLMTLAQMALRRDSRTPTWPARAFLPSRGTFVRRIEMLRNTNRIRHAPLPALARLLTVGGLSALGLLVAGFRGPAGSSTAQAQSQQPVVAGTQTAADASYNLAFVPADAKLIVAVRPNVLLDRREVRTLLESIKQSSAFKAALILPPEEVEQLIVFWEGIPQAPATADLGRTPMVPFPSGAVLRTSKPQEWKSLLKNERLGSAREVRHDGQTYLSFGTASPQAWGVFTPDDRTLVLAREDLLRELIEDRKIPAPRHPWDEAWNKVVKGQLMVALETRWLRRRISQGQIDGPTPGLRPNVNLTLETISPLLDRARSYAISIDVARGLTVDLIAVAGTEDDAKPVANTLQAVLTLGKNAVQGMRQDLRGRDAMNAEAMDWIVEAADSLLTAARLDTEGGYVRLQAKSPVDLAGAVKIVLPAVAAANTAARRQHSVNNLKQIALAFHNYHSANNQFPTPELYGGTTGKVPFSWRVAILPYLEQGDLYKRYDFDEPWDGPNNRKLLDLMPAVYSYPSPDGSPASRTNTAYFVFAGKAAALGVPAGEPEFAPTLSNFHDGPSTTILAVESKREVPWTKPEDIPFDVKGPLPELKGFVENGFNVAFVDGSVRFISKTIDSTVLKALITRAGGEVINMPDGPAPVRPSTH
jgi:prepilin-type processing-associated H-X9-DG protein